MNVIVCLFNDTATTDIYTDGHTLSLHDALPISFEPYLMSAECIVELQEEVGIRFDAAVGFGIELDHPALDAVRVELAVPGPVQRVRELDSPAVTARPHNRQDKRREGIESGVPCRIRWTPYTS